jgi:putative DNA primase/helicase
MTYPSAPKGSAVQAWIDSLDALGIEYAGAISGGNGGKWACPIHDDEHPSLDVTVGRNGKPIFRCTPCAEAFGQENFASALRDAGVSWTGKACEPAEVDWGPAAIVVKPSTKAGSKGAVHLTATYSYNHADGTENFRVKRYDPDEGSEARKHFVPKRFALGEGWKTGLDGVERTPYLLDRFEGWAAAKKVIYLVEGEKAADALLGAEKAVTTFHGGTAGKVEPDWVTRYGFDRFAEVRLWPDADEAGVERMVALAHDLHKADVRFRYFGSVECQPKDDAYDVLERGHASRIRPLTDADLDLLKAMHPKPKLREKPARETQVVVEVAGAKALVGAEPIKRVNDEKPKGKPFSTSIQQRSWDFTKEFIDRHFRTDEGLLTLRLHYDDRKFWLWEDHHYVVLTDDQVKARVGDLLEGARESYTTKVKEEFVTEVRVIPLKTSMIEEVVRCLGLQTITSKRGRRALKPSEGGIPFRNGWLDAESGVLEPLRPDRDVRWIVPAEYDEQATCPEWFAFLDSIGWTEGTEERRLIQQWVGHLISGATDIHKGMLLIGPKRAGKGTVLDVCSALLGDGAVGIQLDSFDKNFGMQNLIGKGLATIGDARFGLRTNKAVVERLLSLTGFDTMQIDVKQKDPMSVRLPTRLMIATNESPKFIEASDALSTRFLILNFVTSFYRREDLRLKHRLMKELPGIARWALAGYRDLRAQGFFTETEKGLEMQEQMIHDAAPIRSFIEDECVLGASHHVVSQELFDRYRTWCEQANTYVMDRSTFFRDLNTAYPGKFENTKRRVNGKQVPHKIGLALK